MKIISRWSLLYFLLLFSPSPSTLAYDNGLGLTPPMGWNSWNHFACQDLNEVVVQEIAQAVKELQLDHLGYRYINLDDCWQHHRNETGYIVEDFDKFPNGIPALRKYIHSLDLKFGLYSDAGWFTCQRRPGSLGFERKDAQVYANWKIDYLKYDNCFSLQENLKHRYQRMHDALNATGHPIFFSLCEWGYQQPATWAGPVGNSWRTTGDIAPNWKSMTKIVDQNNQWHDFAGPGGWNDPDMLEVGNVPHWTLAEQRSHFTLWCLMKAPLLLGNDLRNMTKDVMNIITNSEVIAWNQDPLGQQGYRRVQIPVNPPEAHFLNHPEDQNDTEDETLEVWAGDLNNGDIAVVLWNRSLQTRNITATWSAIGLLPGEETTLMKIRDVWEHCDLGVHTHNITFQVDSHDVVALQFSRVQSAQISEQE